MNRFFKSLLIPLAIVLGISAFPKIKKQPSVIKQEEVVSKVSESEPAPLSTTAKADSVAQDFVSSFPNSVSAGEVANIKLSGNMHNVQDNTFVTSMNEGATLNIVLDGVYLSLINQHGFVIKNASESAVFVNVIYKGSTSMHLSQYSAFEFVNEKGGTMNINFCGGSASSVSGGSNVSDSLTMNIDGTQTDPEENNGIFKFGQTGSYIINFMGTSTNYTVSNLSAMKTLTLNCSKQVNFNWSNDYSECTATINFPSSQGQQPISLSAEKTNWVKDTEATCVSNEKGHYEAVFNEFPFFEETISSNTIEKSDSIDPNHHDWKITYTWNKDSHSFTGNATCNNCSETATETPYSSYLDWDNIQQPATCTQNAKTGYFATFEAGPFAGHKEYSIEHDSTLYEIPGTKLDHDYSIYSYSFKGTKSLFSTYGEEDASVYAWSNNDGVAIGKDAFSTVPSIVVFIAECSHCDSSLMEVVMTREVIDETIKALEEQTEDAIEGNPEEIIEFLLSGMDHSEDLETRLQFVEDEPATYTSNRKGHFEITPNNEELARIIGKAVTPTGSYEQPGSMLTPVLDPDPAPAPSGPSQEQLQELAQEITQEITVESFNEILSQVEDVAVLVNDVVQFDEKMTENINTIAADSQENAIAIISSVNEAASALEELKGELSQEEYEQKVETLQAIVETSCEIAASMDTVATAAQESMPTFEAGSPAASLDLGSAVKDFYQRQLDAILGTGSSQEEYSPMSSSKYNDIIFVFADEPKTTQNKSNLDLDTSADTYRKAIEFIDNSVEDMKNIASYVRECSNEEFVKHINETISGISHRVFKNFDKAAADAEFVENVRKAMTIHLQQETLIALDANYEEVKKSSAYSGNAKETFDRQYQEEREAVLDLEMFEDMLIEIMRQKYVTILNNRLSSKQIDKAKYETLMLDAIDIDTFAPIYDQIFTNWALYQDNDPEYAGITLEELSNTVIGNVTHKTSQINLRKGLTVLEIIFLSFVILAGTAIAYFGYFKNRKKESARA